MRKWFLEYGNKCVHCGSTDNLTRDHILPKSKGGSNRMENIQPLCVRCNAKKGNTLEDELQKYEYTKFEYFLNALTL